MRPKNSFLFVSGLRIGLRIEVKTCVLSDISDALIMYSIPSKDWFAVFKNGCKILNENFVQINNFWPKLAVRFNEM